MNKDAANSRPRYEHDLEIPNKKYLRPPVVEALCEIFFSESEWISTIPGKFFNIIEKEYPLQNELQQVEAAVNVSPTTQSAQFQAKGSRVQFLNGDRSRVVQLEKDLLVINQLRPYQKFSTWQPVIFAMLKHYDGLVHPKGVKQIGLRYINDIELPLPPADKKLRMEDYFKIFPQVPEELGGTHGRFMLRMDIPPLHKDHGLVITLVLRSMKDNEPVHFMLDIYDIFVSQEKILLDSVPSLVTHAHENIVLAFEKSLTENTKNLFSEEK